MSLSLPSIGLLFRRASLRLQGYEADFSAGLFDSPRGFEDYTREKDQSRATITNIESPKIKYFPAPAQN